VGAVLRAVWSWVLELVEVGFNISRHGDVNVSIVLVPADGDATVEFAGPVGGD
jgi:hypothetical protein